MSSPSPSDANPPARRGVLLLAVLVVLAGCNFGPWGGSTPTVTPVDVPNGTNASSVRYPPGVAVSGAIDAEDLVDAHRSALADTSVTTHRNRTERYANGTLRHGENESTRFAGDQDRYHRVGTFDGSVTDVERWATWSNGSVVVSKVVDGGRSIFRRGPVMGTPRYSYDDRLAVLAARIESATVPPGSLAGTRVYRIRARGIDQPRAVLDLTGVPDDRVESVDAVAVTLYVRPDGLVRRAVVAYTATTERVTIRVREVIRVTGVGETAVPRPGWVPAAIDATEE